MLSANPSFYNIDASFLFSYSGGERSRSNIECIPTFTKELFCCFKGSDNGCRFQSCGLATVFQPDLYQVIKTRYSIQFRNVS